MTQGFTVRKAGLATAKCPVCGVVFTYHGERETAALLVRHLNFEHDAPVDDEDR